MIHSFSQLCFLLTFSLPCHKMLPLHLIIPVAYKFAVILSVLLKTKKLYFDFKHSPANNIPSLLPFLTIIIKELYPHFRIYFQPIPTRLPNPHLTETALCKGPYGLHVVELSGGPCHLTSHNWTHFFLENLCSLELL